MHLLAPILSAGFVAIAVYGYGAHFDLIAPDDGIFEDGCVMRYGYCHGVYFGNKNNSQLNTVIGLLNMLSVARHCGDHDNIAKYGITCSPGENLLHTVWLICVELITSSL